MRSKTISILVGLLVVASLANLPAVAGSRRGQGGNRPKAVSIAIRHLGVKPKSVKVTDLYTSDHNRVTHVYLRQIVKGE
ncbi:MAG: hypothetical protein M3279_06675, partial [Actinomycetota bacterium]|nr:hypothetical protein [Actinomycetota bacterium]